MRCIRCFQILQEQLQELFIFKLQVFGKHALAINQRIDQLFACTDKASIAFFGMTQIQYLNRIPGPFGLSRYQSRQVELQFGFAFSHQRRKWQLSSTSTMATLIWTLATGDDVGKIQRSVRRTILGFKMFVMGVINRDGLTAIRT